MTEQDIQARIKDLQEQAQQMQANLNAIQGAIVDCQYWLAKMKEKPSEEDVS